MKTNEMPLVKIELLKGFSHQTISKLMDVVADVVVESLKLPPDDRNIRVIEYDKLLFRMKEPYSIIVEITLFTGRTIETKKQLYRSITDTISQQLNIDKQSIFIVLNEQPLDNWGVRGGVPASEIKLNFNVNI